MNAFSINKKFTKFIYLAIIFLVAFALAFVWQRTMEPDVAIEVPVETKFASVKEPIQPIPQEIKLNQQKVALGKKLFEDTSLSGDGKVACVSCHNLQMGGVDRKRVSDGVKGQLTAVNTLTVFNSGFNFRLNWNGQYRNLYEHLEEPLIGSTVMGSTWPQIMEAIENSSGYVRDFSSIYADGITRHSIKDAIATFQMSLITPNSPFDRFLLGDSNAITEEEKEGYQIFKDYGCISCHQGINVGGNLFQKFGVLEDYFRDRGNITRADLGRFNVTGDESDRYVFRVPSLRNVELTPPYFHDGSAETLEDAINVMAKYQLGRSLSQEQIHLIVLFLKTLTGEYKGEPL
ncbi:MAG: cytochrome c peroxidase [Cyanobacteriota bacterium]|nr:cytochrome c peroxidase [Cyanobacteriota bacterium]